MELERSDNKLGTMPIGKLLVSMSVPMMISMFVQALYNMVDSMFVAQLSEDALTAVSLAFPVQNAMAAIAVGTAIGMSAFVSRSLGRQDREGAEKGANVPVLLCALYSVIFALLGFFFVRGFYSTQTDVESIIRYGEDYLGIVCMVSFGCFYSQIFEKLLVATGSSTLSMISQAAGAVFNIIFDPLLIFGIGPFPEMGVKGAAVATVLGQIFASIIALVCNLRYNRATRFSLSKMMPNMRILKEIYSVGVPSMVTIGLGSVGTYCVNRILLTFSTTAAAVFGIWLKMQSFGYMPVFGMNNGTIAIYSYNYGARHFGRVRKTQKLALVVGICVTAAVTILYECIPDTMLRLFNASDNMYAIGRPAMRICVLSLPLGAASIILASAFQSLRRARYTMIVNVMRNFAVLALAAWLLSLSGSLTAVWFAPVAAELAALITAIFFEGRVMGRLEELN